MILKRQCDILDIAEETTLVPRLDFRLPQYRREVFLRFYGFHLSHATHPGLVYLLFPYLSRRYGWSMEQKLWFAFINGCTQNPLTTWVVFTAFPELPTDMEAFDRWHQSVWKTLDWDMDRHWCKGHLTEMVASYRQNLAGRSQEDFFFSYLADPDPRQHFKNVWNVVMTQFNRFGRLSTFSYLEYLCIMGVPLEYDSFFMDDLSGSKSHRNGILKVLGRDDLDWFRENPSITTHGPDLCKWAEEEAWLLVEEARSRYKHAPFVSAIGAQTLESTLCCYKSWHRENRRYPNVYTDMHHDRIRKAERLHPTADFSMFWDARREGLPPELRLEDNPWDVGVKPLKQNWYRTTGQPIMMEHYDPVFANDYREVAQQQSVPLRKKPSTLFSE